MSVEVRYYTDPACSWSWGAEPKLRRLMWEFSGELDFRWIMGGLARRFGPEYRDEEGSIGSGPSCFADLMSHWLNVGGETGMPSDPRIWTECPLSSTYPACMAVKAACEQGPEAGYRYLRRVREGIFIERRRLDHADALAAEAGPAGLDSERFRLDLGSHAIVEAFGADLDEVRDVPEQARTEGKVRRTEGHERVSMPSAVFIGADGARHAVWGWKPLEDYREAALAAGASPVNEGALGPLEAIERFGRLTTKEAEVLSGHPGPLICAELWNLAKDWRLRPVRALTGTIWEKA